MKFAGLATDYDGTIARHGDVNPSTHDALQRWKNAGRKLILVTGRELPDLARVYPSLSLFDRVVAENGALLFCPASGQKKLLTSEPPMQFVDALRTRGVSPLSIGEAIVSTQESFRGVVLETIESLGMKLKVIPNKGALMVLPVQVDKATGLLEALKELNLDPSDIAAVGDAENDHAFLGICGYSAAVANALGFLKKEVHYVTTTSHGAGVEELIDRLLANDPPGPLPSDGRGS